MQWFRMYAEFADDPKVQMLSEAMQRRFVMLCCLAAKGQVPTDDDEVIAFALRISPEETAKTKQVLAGKGLIGENWKPTSFDKRQYKSDHDAAERKRRQRSRDSHNDVTRDVTADGCDSHGLEQIQNRTEQNRTESGRARRAARRCPADFEADLEFAKRELPDVDAEAELAKFRDYEFLKPRSDWAAVWRNWIRRCKETGRYSRKAGSTLVFGGKPVEWQ